MVVIVKYVKIMELKMFNQLLTEIKEDLKELEPTRDNESCTQGIMRRLLVQERIKTKLQAYHRMASLWLEDANSKQIVYWDGEHQDWEWDYDKELIKELSTFINEINELMTQNGFQEIEKIAKQENIEL